MLVSTTLPCGMKIQHRLWEVQILIWGTFDGEGDSLWSLTKHFRFSVCLHLFTIPHSSLYFYYQSEKVTPSLLQFVLFDTLLHRGKACSVFAPQEMRRIVWRWQERCCKDICADTRSIVIFSSTGNNLWSYIFPSYLLERLYNEIDWESLKNSQKQKRGGKNETHKNHRLLYQEKDDAQVTEEFDISEGEEKDGKTSGRLWGSSLRGLYK